MRELAESWSRHEVHDDAVGATERRFGRHDNPFGAASGNGIGSVGGVNHACQQECDHRTDNLSKHEFHPPLNVNAWNLQDAVPWRLGL
jgi:hypothetical protein